jgi:hypothetical protein
VRRRGSRDGPAAHRDLDRLDEAASRGRGGAHVRLDADVHADDPGRHRAGRADDERQARPPAEIEAEGGGVGDVLRLEDRDDEADHDGADEGEDADRRVLPPDEGDGAFEDRAGDVLHRLGARVAGQHVAGQVHGKQHGDEAGRQDDQLERARIHRAG